MAPNSTQSIDSQAATASSGASAPAAPAGLAALLRPTEALGADAPLAMVGDRMLDPSHEGLLSLPIVHEGRPVAAISRYALMRVFLMPFGREIFGRRPIIELANREVLVMPVATSIQDAARLIAEHVKSPITEDFILTDADGVYLGTGVVLDVLRAMDARLAQRNRELQGAYDRVRSSQLQLVQSEKMASLGQMVAGLVHEINTPLGYVRNNVEMTREALADATQLVAAGEGVLGALLDGGEPPADLPDRMAALAELRTRVDTAALEDLSGLLEDTLHGLGQIGELIGHLKDFSRLDQARTQKADVNHLIDGALRIIQHILNRRGIQVVRAVTEVPAIECAPAQINQVLLNLLGNAAQAIEHDRGRIIVRTQVLGGRLLVLVEDNGKGIAAEDLKRIFDPFFTTKPVGQGTGLGLAIAHQIVEQHGGVIRVASKPGVGTRFVVALPLPLPAGGAA
ncbi:sensor histidine kinase [Dokdonella koreensis]|uniref:histidine kinase n=1 Tax=Dokdonella koreensis DS-123 TaxID=1300342 RepID=A0A160DVB5_9GAMM|nr:ATP-binding protein [Dokdonella koreensis]ANB18477.1 Two-component sensor histidine kinase [Dokdonella koreensis DS-123]